MSFSTTVLIFNGEKILSVVNVVVWEQVKSEISSLPVAVRVSKTRVLKDVRAHCYCASLVRTLVIRHARATSFSSACTKPKTQQNIELMTFVFTWCANIFCWILRDLHFFFGGSLPFLIPLSIILKTEKNLYVGSFNFFLKYYSNRVELVHGYRCAWLRSWIF